MSNRNFRVGKGRGKQFVKIDEDEFPIYEKSIDMLLEAGYFRARIPSLSPFDKIVGGLCWCITNAAMDIEVGSIHFHEEPTIGQKAAISDGIIRSLRLMQCPIRLQSFQILGLDIKILHDVLKFLIQKVFETREEHEERIRKYSTLMFSRNFLLKSDQVKMEKLKNAKPYLQSIRGLYEAKRRFIKEKKKAIRRRKQKKKKFKWGNVQSVLLEYGKEFEYIKKKKGKGDKKGETDVKVQKQVDKEEEKLNLRRKRKIERIKKSLKHLSDKESGNKFVKNNVLNKFVLKDKSNIASLNVDFETMKKTIRENVDVSMNISLMHKRHLGNRMKHINSLKKEMNEKKKEIKEIIDFIKKKQALSKEKKMDNKEIQKKITQLNNRLDNLSDEDKETLDKLRKLIALNENLKKQEKLFRIQVQNQIKEYAQIIEKLKLQLEGSHKNQNASNSKIKKIKELVDQKFANLKRKMQKENKKFQLIERKIDEIPIASELKQFEKRFSELIVEIFSNDKETRKFFDSFNTSSKILKFTENKYSLFSSIEEKYDKAVNVNRKNYSKWVTESVKKSLEQIKISSNNVGNKMEEQKRNEAKKNKIFSDLVMKKREYFRLVKRFEDESKKNEEYSEKLDKIKALLNQKKEEQLLQQQELERKKKEEQELKEKEERIKKMMQLKKESQNDEEEGEYYDEEEGEYYDEDDLLDDEEYEEVEVEVEEGDEDEEDDDDDTFEEVEEEVEEGVDNEEGEEDEGEGEGEGEYEYEEVEVEVEEGEGEFDEEEGEYEEVEVEED